MSTVHNWGGGQNDIFLSSIKYQGDKCRPFPFIITPLTTVISLNNITIYLQIHPTSVRFNIFRLSFFVVSSASLITIYKCNDFFKIYRKNCWCNSGYKRISCWIPIEFRIGFKPWLPRTVSDGKYFYVLFLPVYNVDVTAFRVANLSIFFLVIFHSEQVLTFDFNNLKNISKFIFHFDLFCQLNWRVCICLYVLRTSDVFVALNCLDRVRWAKHYWCGWRINVDFY